MKCLFIGKIQDPDLFIRLKESNVKMAYAQQNMENLLLEGFKANNFATNTSILSTLHIPRYPKYRKVIIKPKEAIVNDMTIKYLRFFNLPIIKQISLFYNKIISIRKWIKKNKTDKKVIFIYATNPLDTIPVFILRFFYKIKVITFVSEIDSLRLWNKKNILSRIKTFLYVRISKSIQNNFDGYIYVSNHMASLINKKKKPNIAIEGMVKDDIEYINCSNKTNEIIYVGTLDKQYGLDNLIIAFKKVKPDYKLVFYGDGNYRDELIQLCNNDENIIYGGLLLPNEVIEIERKAKLLINPRPSNLDLTKYSFPSKILEYMSSGTPCMITKLDGIPEEYYNYCFNLGTGSINDIELALLELDTYHEKQLTNLGKEAFDFVYKNKNSKLQTAKILEFFKKI